MSGNSLFIYYSTSGTCLRAGTFELGILIPVPNVCIGKGVSCTASGTSSFCLTRGIAAGVRRSGIIVNAVVVEVVERISNLLFTALALEREVTVCSTVFTSRSCEYHIILSQ